MPPKKHEKQRELDPAELLKRCLEARKSYVDYYVPGGRGMHPPEHQQLQWIDKQIELLETKLNKEDQKCRKM